jgi:hypothetical protein
MKSNIATNFGLVFFFLFLFPTSPKNRVSLATHLSFVLKSLGNLSGAKNKSSFKIWNPLVKPHLAEE